MSVLVVLVLGCLCLCLCACACACSSRECTCAGGEVKVELCSTPLNYEWERRGGVQREYRGSGLVATWRAFSVWRKQHAFPPLQHNTGTLTVGIAGRNEAQHLNTDTLHAVTGHVVPKCTGISNGMSTTPFAHEGSARPQRRPFLRLDGAVDTGPLHLWIFGTKDGRCWR